MIAIIGASILSIVLVLSFLIACGLPLGELTMGGKYKVFPSKLRILLVLQTILQIFCINNFANGRVCSPVVFRQSNKSNLYCNGNISINKYYFEFLFKEQEREIYNDTAFNNFRGMLLDNRNITDYVIMQVNS